MPCHSKFDTEAIAQLFVPHSQRKRERKEAGEDRKAYNEKVWTKILRLEKVNAKMKNAGFSFHHRWSSSISLILEGELCARLQENENV